MSGCVECTDSLRDCNLPFSVPPEAGVSATRMSRTRSPPYCVRAPRLLGPIYRVSPKCLLPVPRCHFIPQRFAKDIRGSGRPPNFAGGLNPSGAEASALVPARTRSPRPQDVGKYLGSVRKTSISRQQNEDITRQFGTFSGNTVGSQEQDLGDDVPRQI
ncbi:hypothetical protein Bbelb_067130 [Branchiostoma belcheri]|nr:hypothetical protein Bbelb_067130 [Branchiostoma belcheri]